MFRYQLKSAFRYFSKQKIFISINILGLVIAFAVSSLIMLYVINELKYDSEHKNRRQIYRVLTNRDAVQTVDALTTLDLGPLIKEEFPEVEKMSRYITSSASIVKSEKEITTSFVFVDPDFLEMFTLKSGYEIAANLLSDPNAVIISEKMAQKVFGDKYPIGEDLHIKFPQGKENFFKVAEVFKNPGLFSSVNGDLFINFEYYDENLCDAFLRSYPFFTTFLMTASGSDIPFIEEKINKVNREEWTGIASNKYELQKYSRMYLQSAHLSNSFFNSGNSKILNSLSFLVILVVIMACLNFGILSTACAFTRNKEIGVRKINGARLNQVKRQIMLESFLQVFLAVPLALGTARMFLPLFNKFVNRQLDFNFTENLVFIAGLVLLIVITALTSGVITSASVAKVNPIGLLRKENIKFKSGLNLNKILLTGQMVIVIWFLVVTLLVYKQINFSQKKGLGYNPENIVAAQIHSPRGWNTGDIYNPRYQNENKLENFKQSLLNQPSIEKVSEVFDAIPFDDQIGSGSIKIEGMNDYKTIASMRGTSNYPEFFEFRIKSGNYFSENYSGNSEHEYILNEAAVKYLGLTDPVGKRVILGDGKFGQIVGVVEDFNFQSMREDILPLSLSKSNKTLSQFNILLKYSPGLRNEAVSAFNELFEEYYPDYESSITFQDERLRSLYEKEITESRIFAFGIGVALFIAVMGIFGISLFTVRQQVKEIGVRKINGATVSDILSMLNINIVKWVGIAFVISTPLAIYQVNKWLENFAYKTTLSWWVFALAGIMAIGIALLTVSWQSWKAATRNPVEALRYE